MKDLKLGVLGISPGNGHPYSWSAIFNGYDPVAMAGCPFPVIQHYLATRRFPEDAIGDARVTHVWTQDPAASEHIAAAALIPTVVAQPSDMIGHVDAILLARDDAENHLNFAAPFLAAGIPVYIDKPLALSRAGALAIYSRQKHPGLVFTCSALAYARELMLDPKEREALGPLRHVDAVAPKDWDRYAIHAIEPLLNLIGMQGGIRHARAFGHPVRSMDLEWASGLTGRIVTLGVPAGPIEIRLFGEHTFRTLRFEDSFEAFRAALKAFIEIVAGDRPNQNPEQVLPIIDIVEAGRATP
jgi:predicted dehydrogenase